MLVDSHCHLNSISLAEFNEDMGEVIRQAEENDVGHLLSVCVELSEYPELERLALQYPNISISVGAHPNSDIQTMVNSNILCDLAKNKSCIAIGETGLDYYRTTTLEDQHQQGLRFREHIRAAIQSKKPLIIHTRQAAEETLKIMAEENADTIGGVMHCFSENHDIAKRAMELNFYISFSGILTFKNATILQDVAKQIPIDRILIETDSPYLAPIPFRGKQNHPALVKYVALALADLRGISYEEVAERTTENFNRCFLRD